jgi:hypothetical protein
MIKKTWIGGMGPYQYDNNNVYPDALANLQGMRTEGQIIVETAPTQDNHVVRLADIEMVTIRQLEVASLEAPTELNAYGGADGRLVWAYKDIVGTNEGTLYCWDPAVAGGPGQPFEVAASDTGRWIAIAGKYIGLDINMGAKHLWCGGIQIYGDLSMANAGHIYGSDAQFNKDVIVNTAEQANDFVVNGNSTALPAFIVDNTLKQVRTDVAMRQIFKGTTQQDGPFVVNNNVTLNANANSGNTVIKKQGGGAAFYVDYATARSGFALEVDVLPTHTVDVNGTFYAASTSTFKQAAVFNSERLKNNFTVYGDGAALDPAIYVNATANKVGIFQDNPQYVLDVVGTVGVSGHVTLGANLIVNNSASNGTFSVKGFGTGNLIHADPSTGRISVNCVNPVATLQVVPHAGDTMAGNFIGDLVCDQDFYSKTIAVYESSVFNYNRNDHNVTIYGSAAFSEGLFEVLGGTNKITMSGVLTTIASPLTISNATVMAPNLPSSAVGLSIGQVYHEAGVLKVKIA